LRQELLPKPLYWRKDRRDDKTRSRTHETIGRPAGKENTLEIEEESLARTLWKTCFGGDYRLITRQTTQWIRVLHIRPGSHLFPYTSYLSHHSRTILSFDAVHSCTYCELSQSLLKTTL